MKTPILPSRFRSLSTAAALAMLGLPLHAATVTWDNSNATNAWSTPANWDTNLEPVAADDVILPLGLLGSLTLTLSAGENAKTLTINDNYTLTGGGLTLASASTIGVLLGKSATINTAISATGGATKTGDGTLTLGTTNAFTGGFVVNAGTLRIGSINAINSGNTITVNAGAILEAANVASDRAITWNNGATLAGSGTAASFTGIITIDALATAVTLGTVAGGDLFTVGNAANDLTGGTAATTINVAGPGTVRLGAASNFDGSWSIPTGARLELGAAGALGDTAASGVTLAGGTLVPRLSTATTFTGQTNLTVTANSLIVSDRATSSSGVTHTLGTLAIGTNTLTVTPGANVTSGVGGIVLGSVTLSGNPTFAVGNSGNAGAKLTTGALLGGGVARTITKTGTGDLALTGGATDLLAGSAFTMSGGGNLDLLFPALGAGASVAVSDAQHPLGAASFAMTGGTLNLLADGDNTTSVQNFALANGLTLSGDITLDPNRRGGSNTNKVFDVPSLTLAAGAVVNMAGDNTYGVRITGATTLQGNVTLQGTTLASRDGRLTFNGAIGDGGSGFSVTIGGGTSPLVLTMNAASTYSGGTNMSASTVTLNAANALGTGPLVQSGGTLTAGVTGAIADAVTLSGGSMTLNAANAIGGAIVISGGTLRANGSTAIQTNPISLNGGTLDLRTNVVATFTTGTFTLGGDAMMNFANNGSGSNFTPTFGSALNVSGNRTLTVTSANGHTPNFANIALAGDLTLSSGVAVSVQAIGQDATPRRFIKAGTGTTTLTGTGTFTGGAEVLAGVLLINDTGALGGSVLTVGDMSGVAQAIARLGVGSSLASNIVVRSGSSGTAILSTTTGGLTWSGNITLQKTGTLEGTSGITTFGGVIGGVGNIGKIGSGEIILENAANSFGNGTAASVNITAGTLTVANDGALGAAGNGVTIAGGTTFRANGTFTSARTITPAGTNPNIDVTTGNVLTLDAALGGNIAFDKEGLGTLAFGPAVTSARTATTTLNDGTLRLTGATGLGTASTINFTGGTLDLRNDANTNYAHPLTITSGTNIVNVDRAEGGVATGGTHTLGTVALGTQTLNTTGSNGFGLALGTVTTTGTSTLNHDAPGALTVAAIALGGASGTLTFTQDGEGGDVFITGTIADGGTPIWNFAKRGSHTLRLGTGFMTDGTLTVADGTLDLNNLNVPLSSTLTLGGGALNTTASIVTGTGLLFLGGTLTYSANSAPLGANITGNLDLGAAARTFTINDNSSAPVDLDINGPISGAGGVGFTKGGTGTLRLSGAGNTFNGPVTVQSGTVELNKSSGNAITSNPLTISTTATATVRLLANEQINDAAPVSILNLAGSARLDLAGFTETLGLTVLTATTTSGASITTGAAGTLVLSRDLTLQNSFSSVSASTTPRRVLITGTGTTTLATTDGTLDLGGVLRNIAVTTSVVGANAANANALIETAIVNGGINKTGPQVLFLTNPASTFAGGLNIAEGIVDVNANGAAGVGPITFNNTAASALRLSTNGTTLSNPIVISAAGAAEAKITYSGGTFTTSALTGALTLERDLVVDVVTGFIDQGSGDLFGRLVLTGNIDDGAGTFSITKKGNGFLSLTGLNTHGGGVIVEKGTLAVSADASLGATGAPLTISGGALFAEGSVFTPRAIIFTSAGSVRVDAPNALELAGAITHTSNDVGFFGGGTTILSGTGGGGAGNWIVGKYASDYADPGTGTPQIEYGHTLSVRGAVALPAGNTWLLNEGVLELGTGDFTRAVGSGAGQVRMETFLGAGFAAHGANRIVNLGGAGATLILGDPATDFLRADTGFGFDGVGALILGSATATHTVTFQNPIEFNNGDPTSGRTITVPDGPAAKEAILSGDLSLNGLPGTMNIFLELNVRGALDITGDISGEITLSMFGDGKLTLTGVNTFVGFVSIDDGGTLNVTSDAAMGDVANQLSLFNGATLQAGANLTIHRTIQIASFGGPANIIDTNGFDVLLDTDSAVFGSGGEVEEPEFLEKIGAGTLTLRGLLDIAGLTTSAGTTNLETALGSGTSILNANAETNITVDQTLAELNIGDGAVVTLGSAAPAPGFAHAVPEPGSVSLLALGAMWIQARRRRCRD